MHCERVGLTLVHPVMWFPLVVFFSQCAVTRWDHDNWSYASQSGDSTKLQWVTPEVRAPRVRQYTIESKAAKTQVSYHLYLPAAYEAEKSKKFPVLYWLHGSGGGLPGIRPVSGFFDSAIEAGKIPPMIIVFPNSFANGMWCDSADGKQPIETIVMKELIPEVDAKFRTISKREGRMVEGFSMGGYGAGRLGFKFPKMFAGVSMLAGGPLDLDFKGPRAAANPKEREKILQTVFGGDMANFKAQSPWTWAEKHATGLKKGTLIRMCIGEDDFTLPANREFSSYLKKLGIPHTFMIKPKVGHDTIGLLTALAEDNWKYYRDVFAAAGNKPMLGTVAASEGIEPPAPSLGRRRSIH